MQKIRFLILPTLLVGVGVFLFGSAFADTIIPGNIDTSLQVIQRLLITIDGSPLGSPIADMNTGGNIIFYAPIKDSAGHRYITSESDPYFSASAASSVTASEITHWNTAYTRGNHALMGYLTGESDPLWMIEKTNYYTKSDVDTLLSSSVGGLRYKGVWDYSTGVLPSDIAVGYFFKVNTEGNHNGLHLYVGDMIIANTTINGATATGNWDVISNSISEMDPVFSASVVAGIGGLDIGHWNDAYARGNHALMGYLTGEVDPQWNIEKANYYTKEDINSKEYLTSESDPQWNTDKNDYYTKAQINTKGYLTSESDPQWNAEKTGYYTKEQIDSKLDFSGFLTNFTELDPLFSASVAAQLSASDLTQFHGAADWISNNSGNALYFFNNSGDYYTKNDIDTKGFLTGFDESDPMWNLQKINYYTRLQADARYLTGELDPLFLISPAASISAEDLAQWRNNSTRVSNNSGSTYSRDQIDSFGFLSGETDPQWNAVRNNYYTKTQLDTQGFITGFAEVDPLFASSLAGQITPIDFSNWYSAYTWVTMNSGNYYTKSDIDAKGFLTGSAWNQSGNNINYMSGNVGIGTNNPSYQLDVQGTTNQGARILGASGAGIVVGAIDGSFAGIWNSFVTPAANNYALEFSNTSTYLGGSSNVYLNTNGLTRLRVDNNGNIGIGMSTTTPTSRVQIKGSGLGSTTSSLSITDNNSNPKFMVKDDGSVGIGTGSAAGFLDIYQQGTGVGLVSNTAGSTSVVGSGTRFTRDLYAGDSITIGGQTVSVSGISSDTGLTVGTAITNANTNTGYTVPAYSKFSVNGSQTSITQSVGYAKVAFTFSPFNLGYGSSLNFLAGGYMRIGSTNSTSGISFTTNMYGSQSEKVSIYGNGNMTVGISPTSSSSGLFQVSQGTAGIGTVTNLAGGTTVTGTNTQFTNIFKVGDTITIGSDTATISAITSDTVMTTSAITNSHNNSAYTLPGGDRFVVQGNGNVGIGTMSPTYPLDISGASMRIKNPTTGGNTTITLENNNINATQSYVGQYTIGNEQAGGSPYQLNRIVIAPKNNTMVPILAVRQYDQNTSQGAFFEFYNRGGPGTSIYEGLRIMVGNPFSQAGSMDATIDTQAGGGGTLRNIQLKPGGITSLFLGTNGNNGIGTVSSASKWGVLGNLAVGTTYGNIAAPVGGAIIQGNLGVGTSAPTSLLHVAQPTAGVGTVTVATGGTTVTGVGTQFTNTFKVGDSIIIAGQTGTISTISSDTSIVISPAVTTGATSTGYTLVGGDRFVVKGNGYVGIGTTGPTAQLSVSTPSYGATNSVAISDGAYNYYIGGSASATFVGNYMKLGASSVIGFLKSNMDFSFYDTNSNPLLYIRNSLRNIGIGTSSPIATLQVTQGTAGMGTVTNLAGGTTITGTNTQFTNTFKVGDSITIGTDTVTISAITSDTVMTTSTITNAHTNSAYTLVGGDRFVVKGNGNVGIGTTSPSAV
ncbi:MAG: hypothetical protein WCO66_04475, partial [Candidatus Absconditabacteria bacterium]